jgi:chemotaxis protein CheX
MTAGRDDLAQELLASDEQIAGITEAVWMSFTGKVIRSADGQAPAGTGDVTVGRVAVTGEWRGWVLLACPPQLARSAASAMFDRPAGELTEAEVADALGELTNMIGGNVKSLLPGPSFLSMPEVTAGPSSATRIPDAVLVSQVELVCEGLRLAVSLWRP